MRWAEGMSVRDIFGTMDYGPAPESAAEAMAWLAGRDATFGHWIDGAFAPPGKMFETRSPGTGTVLARVTQGTPADIDTAVAAARRAQPGWAALSGHARARVLYALARMVQRHARLFAVMESLDAGKPIRESRDIDVPLVARHLYYHAGLAQLAPRECPGMVPLGVCAAVIPWNFPLLILAWKVAPALAAGNAVVLKPAEWTPLTALIFAQMARDAGLPDGLLNVVTGDGDTGAALVAHAGVDKVAFTGSTGVGREVRRETAGTGRAISLELGGKSPYVVFEDADLDSAVEGLVDAIWFNGGQVCCAGSRLLVQEGVADRLHDKLRARMDTLRTGDPLDKGIDVGAIADPVHRDRIAAMVDASEGAEARGGRRAARGLLLPAHADRGPPFRKPPDARRGVRPRPRLDDLPHARRGRGARQRHRLRARGLGLDRERGAGARHGAADPGGDRLDQRGQHDGRRGWLRRGARKRLWPRRRVGGVPILDAPRGRAGCLRKRRWSPSAGARARRRPPRPGSTGRLSS